MCILPVILSCTQVHVHIPRVCVCVCDIEHCRGYSNKGMLVVGPRPWSALCSLSLLIFEE